LVVTIIEGVTWAIINETERINGSSEGLFMETSMLATREVGLVIIESGSTTSIGDHELITSCNPEVSGAKGVAGIDTGLLVDLS